MRCMRLLQNNIVVFLLLAMLLCSCAPAATEPDSSQQLPTDFTQPTEPETQAPETEQTVPADPIQQQLDGMTLEQKVGQLFFARGSDPLAVTDVQAYQLGGVLLFASDFTDKTTEQVQTMTNELAQGAQIPALIGVDEEGGTVVRVSRSKLLREQPFASPGSIYRKGGLAALADDTDDKCAFLQNLGITVNFAPVCDVTANQTDFMYARAIGADAQTTAQAISTIVSQMAADGIGSVLKHFPGYGSNADTHTAGTMDERPRTQFEQEDFLPFAAGIAAGADAVLVSHVTVACFDADNPASLSAEVHRVLREELGFTGIILTDDLAMAAVSDSADAAELAIRAIEAGNDMIITSDYAVQFPALIQAVQSGRVTEEALNRAVRHVLEWKQKLGLI